MDVKEAIRNHLGTQSGVSGRMPADGEDLFSAGFLDSLTFVQLLVFLQKKFGVSFGGSELRLERFRSIDVIASQVQRKLAPPAGGA